MGELLDKIKQTLEDERDFSKTINLLKGLDDKQLCEGLIWLATDSQNISYYFLILQLIQENETSSLQFIASRMLSVSLVSFEYIAPNHLRRVIELVIEKEIKERKENNINKLSSIFNFLEDLYINGDEKLKNLIGMTVMEAVCLEPSFNYNMVHPYNWETTKKEFNRMIKS